MATKRARKSKEPAVTASALLAALKFISVAQHNDDKLQLYQTHCRLTDGTLTAFDGGLTVGMYVDETLNCAPHTATFIKALERCTDAIAITLQDNGKLSVKSGKLRALVPCAPLDSILSVQPDPPCATLTDTLKTALRACIAVAEDGAPAPACGVLLKAGTAAATDRHMLIEAWHGINLPAVFLPRVSAKAIADCAKPLKEFGFSDMSATFYFDDDSFIKTQLFDLKSFPSYEHILDIESNPWPLPGGFYEGLITIEPFANKQVFFKDGKMLSKLNADDATSYDVSGLPEGYGFNIEQLKTLRPFIHTIHFGATESTSLFFSQDGLVRGAITRVYTPKSVPKTGFADMDDDIPF